MAIAEIEVRLRLKLETVVGRVNILQTLVHTNQLPTIIMIRPRDCLMFHFGGISETARRARKGSRDEG
jgi:hypothetical protein